MGKFSFMHLISPGGRSRMDDDSEDKRDDENAEDDEEYRKSHKASDDDPEDRNDDENASDGDPDDDGKENAEDDEDEEKARARERERCAAIFATSYAAKNTALAAELAFNTRMSVKQAKAVMKAAVAVAVSQKGGLSVRMQHAPQPEIGRDARPAPTDVHAMAKHAMSLYNEATGGKKQ